MTAVTLSWEDPEDAAEFTRLTAEYRRLGWLPDPSRDTLMDLLGAAEVKSGSEEGSGDEPV